MSLNWKIRLSLDDRPHNPMLFLVVSILLHGVVFLCLEIYWQWMAKQTLQTKPEAMIPVKLIEVPPDQVAVKPPPNAKNIASSNSRAGGAKAGGEARSRLSSAAEASASRSTAFVPSQKPSLTQPALTPKSTGHRSQSQPYQLPQKSPPAPPVTTPQKVDNQNVSPRTDATEPKIKPSLSRLLRSVSPVESETHPPKSDRLALNNRPNISPSTAPTTSNLAPSFNRLLRLNPSPVVRETVHPPNSDNRPDTRPSAPTAPSKLKPSSSRLLSSDTNLVVRSTPPPNTNRLALNSHPNSSPPVTPTAPKVSSSSSQPRRTTVAPTAPKVSSSSSQPRRTTPNTNRPALNRHSTRSSSAAPTVPNSSSSNQSPRQSSSLLGGPISLASHDFMGGQGDDSATAARIGSDPQGVDALQDVNLGPYLDGLRREVSQRWHPESPDNSKQTIVSFAVSRTGEVNSLRILQSSGSTSIDQAALQAVRRAAPFNPLPGTYPATSLKIEFKFNINVRGQ